ncbi:MAG: 5-formyltetrahydrofolate cyclo-ligase [Acutalibacteraceae bacterium]
MEKVIDIRPIKKELRQKVREERKGLPKTVKSTLDKKICNRLLNLWVVRECDTFLCYVSTEIEVDTRKFISTLLKNGKKVAVPRCEGERSEMNFYYINSLEELRPGAFGVLEPVKENVNKLTHTENTVCIVPAFAFDKSGFRLGYGKGYYDRYLSRFKGCSIGICYDSNIKESLFHGKYDRNVNMVVTERRILSIDEGSCK